MAAIAGLGRSIAGQLVDVRVTNQEVDVSTLQMYDSFSIGTAAGSVTTPDLSNYDELHFDATWDTGTDALTVFTSKDGINFSPVARKPFDLATRAAAASSSLAANGEWSMELNCKKVKFSKAGTTSTVTVNYSAKVTHRELV